MRLPNISIIIPTFNEEKNIRQCLESIFTQDYTKEKLEVILVDDKSTDGTVDIAKEFPVKISYSGRRHGEISKMIGLRAANGELAVYLDADIHLRGKGWLKKMAKPMLEDKTIIGSFTRYYTDEHSRPIERYLNFDPLQRDSIYQFFSSSIQSAIIEKRNDYFVCGYTENKIPPSGLCLYRKEDLLKLIKNYEMFLELDFLVVLVRNGFNKFAYVPKAGLYHHHASSIYQLVKKRKYNLNKVYLGRSVRLYKWFDLSTPQGIIKVFSWIVFATLIAPSILLGLYKTIKYKDWVGLYEPILNIGITYAIIIEFLKNSKGRRLIIPS